MSSAVIDRPSASPAVVADPRAGKYLTFLLGREEFAIRVMKVREIMGIQDIIAVPQIPVSRSQELDRIEAALQ